MSSEPSNWPPKEGLLTPTVSRRDGILTLSASTPIAAPAALVFAILRDTSRYGEWNTWVPRVTVHAQPADSQAAEEDASELRLGTSFTFHVVMDAAKPDRATDTQLRVSDVSTPGAPSSYVRDAGLADDPAFHGDAAGVFRIAWKTDGGFVSMGLRSERFHDVVVQGEERCEVRTWEVMGGFIAHTVSWMFKSTLNKWFGVWCEDLKKEAEKQWAEKKAEENKAAAK